MLAFWAAVSEADVLMAILVFRDLLSFWSRATYLPGEGGCPNLESVTSPTALEGYD